MRGDLGDAAVKKNRIRHRRIVVAWEDHDGQTGLRQQFVRALKHPQRQAIAFERVARQQNEIGADPLRGVEHEAQPAVAVAPELGCVVIVIDVNVGGMDQKQVAGLR